MTKERVVSIGGERVADPDDETRLSEIYRKVYGASPGTVRSHAFIWSETTGPRVCIAPGCGKVPETHADARSAPADMGMGKT